MNYTAFFEDREKDDKGHTITEFLRWSGGHLELAHDYIQRIFPTKEQSSYSKAPVITDEDIAAFRASETAQNNLRAVYDRMLRFWRLDNDRYKEWGDKTPVHIWNSPNNHNCLRITRVLKSLKLLGMTEEYKDFSERLAYILELRQTNPKIRISDETAQIWKENLYTKENHYYGVNPVSDNKIICDRKRLNNGLTFGRTGSGKSFEVKAAVSRLEDEKSEKA